MTQGVGTAARAEQQRERERSGIRMAPEGERRDTVQDAVPAPWAHDGAPAVAPEARLGQVVAGRWYLREVIGSGSVAAVYEATHVERTERVAVKVLHPGAEASREARLRFLREAHTASTFRHRNIVQILDAGRDDDGTLYQVQELLQGEDLATTLARGPLPVGLAVSVGRQLLSALDEVHAAEFVHRDVKPENVFLARGVAEPVHVKLLDFGIAKHLDPEGGLRTITLRGVVLGTPHYMSPEQLVGDTLGPRSDLWAVGAVLFHALAGRPPFDGQELPELVQRIIHEPVPSLALERPDLPPHVTEAVDRALVHASSRRWQSAADMALALTAGAL